MSSPYRFIKALLRQPVDKTPVWVMRQAGRYLPEYREVRKQAGSFLDLCQNPELACEVTMQPLRRYDLDAAILFSDILTIPDAMDLGLYFSEGEGPKFKQPLKTDQQILALTVPDVKSRLGYVFETVSRIKTALSGKLPLIGFSGSPWTLACYMIEGGGSKDFANAKALLYQSPQVMHHLLEVLSAAVADYLNEQIKAGVDAVMIFDTWGGVLTTRDYQDFSLRSMRQIRENLITEHNGQPIPTIMFTKQGGLWLEAMAESGFDALGLDWTIDIAEAKRRVGDKVALQGNCDPSILLTNPERIRQEVKTILQGFGKGPGHVFNLGHGITPQVRPEYMKTLIDTVHELS